MADYPRPFIRYDGEDDDEDDEEDAIPKIRIGVCAMSKFKTLGLVIDTELADTRTVQLGHTPERTAELLQSIDELLAQTQVGTKHWSNCMAGLFGFVRLFLPQCYETLGNSCHLFVCSR